MYERWGRAGARRTAKKGGKYKRIWRGMIRARRSKKIREKSKSIRWAEKGKEGFADQMAKGLLFGAAVLSQAAAGCFAAAASIDRVRIRLAAEELDENGNACFGGGKPDRAYSVTGVERVSGDPASGPAKDGAEVGKKKMNNIKGAYKPTLKI